MKPLVLAIFLCPMVASAEGLPFAEPPSDNRTDLRYGGVLEESYSARQQAAPPQFGFPVETYRWGWFGASRYSPRVTWGRGYYGDKLRWAYRRGY